MSGYRGFTVSCNAIGAGKLPRKYLILATKELLEPLLTKTNRNMVEAKCSCEITISTRCVFKKTNPHLDAWVKYQLIQVVAPSHAKHAQARRMLEGLLPGCVRLTEYKDTARTRLQCHEFVPDNKKLVFGLHRAGITHYKFGEVLDLEPPVGSSQDRPWKVTKRERLGVSLPPQVFPVQRRLEIVRLLEMLLYEKEDKQANSKAAKQGGRSGKNKSNRNSAAGGAGAQPLRQLQLLNNPPNYLNGHCNSFVSPPPSFGLV